MHIFEHQSEKSAIRHEILLFTAGWSVSRIELRVIYWNEKPDEDKASGLGVKQLQER